MYTFNNRKHAKIVKCKILCSGGCCGFLCDFKRNLFLKFYVIECWNASSVTQENWVKGQINVYTPTKHAHELCSHISRETKPLLSPPQSHPIRVECTSPCLTEKSCTCTKLPFLCMLELTAQVKEGVCTLCRANSNALPTINTDLNRQCVLLPVLSFSLLHTRWLTDNTLQCDCWNWRLLLQAGLYLSFINI